MTARGELVLASATDLSVVVALGRETHRAVIEGAGEPVEHHRVHHGLVANAVPRPGARQQVGRVRHRLHAARDDDVGFAGTNHQVRQVDGLQARETDLVDGGGVDAHGNAGLHGRLAGGDLALAGQDDLTHQDRVHARGVDPGLVEGALDGGAAEVLGTQGGEGPREFSDGGATSGDDDAT